MQFIFRLQGAMYALALLLITLISKNLKKWENSGDLDIDGKQKYNR